MAVCESETCAETIVLSSTKELSVTHQIKNEGSEPVVPYQRKWVWLNLIGIIITHFFGLSAFLLVLRVKLSTVIWSKFFKKKFYIKKTKLFIFYYTK